MKSASGGLVVVLTWLVASMAPNVGATDYIVGGASLGWALALGYDYATWTADKTFVIGDNLIFKYNQQVHDGVMEVTSANYNSCTTTNSISLSRTGNDIIPLTTKGTRYFICSVRIHCLCQMKISITTTATTTAPASPATPGSSTPPTTSDASLSLHPIKALIPLFFAFTSLLLSFFSTL